MLTIHVSIQQHDNNYHIFAKIFFPYLVKQFSEASIDFGCHSDFDICLYFGYMFEVVK